MPLYAAIQPLITELMDTKGYSSHDFMTSLFPRIHEAVADLPPCMPVLLVGYNGYYFESPFNTIRGNRYVVRRASGVELAQTLMDCIYIQCFGKEKVSYLRGVMPLLTKNMSLSPAIEHEVRMSFLDGEAQIVIQFAEDSSHYYQAVNYDGGIILSLEMPTEGSAPRVFSGN
jgi:hypothetical protein